MRRLPWMPLHSLSVTNAYKTAEEPASPGRLRILWAAALWAPAVCAAARGGPAAADLTRMSLEELMRLEVTLAAKKPQKISDTPSAITVITGEDLRRSGVSHLAEALRAAPGIHVVRLDAHNWAVSARGFNDLFANKLLVMMDGRSIYTPLFSGVYWDVQDTFLPDVDRIEVIRGPGATVWGANAVNGVINILTKPAAETQGLILYGETGTENRMEAGFRYGGRLPPSAHYRVYVKGFVRDGSATPEGKDGGNGWQMIRGGFRAGGKAGTDDEWGLQGGAYRGWLGRHYIASNLRPPDYAGHVKETEETEGGHCLGRWKRPGKNGAGTFCQVYFDYTRRASLLLREIRHTADIDGRHTFAWGERHEMTCGLGCRWTADDFRETHNLRMDPASRQMSLYSAFFQDEITLISGLLSLTPGAKLEHNDDTGFEFQPGIKLLFTPSPAHTFWASVARAVRSPSRAERDVRINLYTIPPSGEDHPLPSLFSVFGSDNYGSEELWSWESGIRGHFRNKLYYDMAVFYHDYGKLRTILPGQIHMENNALGPVLVLPSHFSNQKAAKSCGAELSLEYQPASWWRLNASYSYLEVETAVSREKTWETPPDYNNGPRHQIKFRSSLDLSENWEMDIAGRCMARLPGTEIPGYCALDLRLGWRPGENIEISLTGNNLLDPRHPEFPPPVITPGSQNEIERNLSLKVSWRY